MDHINITASEIAQYVYCPRVWWLKNHFTPETTPQMLRGVKFHDSLFKMLEFSWKLKVIGILLIGIGLLLIILIGKYI